MMWWAAKGAVAVEVWTRNGGDEGEEEREMEVAGVWEWMVRRDG